MKTCNFPNCNRTLNRENASGVCRDHNHRRPYCQCPNCKGKGPGVRYEPPERKTPSIPKAPWETAM